MRFRGALLALLLGVCCMTVAGCFYTRLADVKGQLADFDENFEIHEGEKFRIIAKNPVLFSADVVRIMKSRPSTISTQQGKLLYEYILEKQYPDQKNETADYNIIAGFVFIDDKLSEVDIDKKFFAVFPKDIFISIVKAFGSAEVDIQTRRVSASARTEKLNLPDANEVLLLLGEPYSKDGPIWSYKYIRKKGDNTNDREKVDYPVEFTFTDDGRMLKCRSEFLGSPAEFDFTTYWQAIEKTGAADANSTTSSLAEQPSPE